MIPTLYLDNLINHIEDQGVQESQKILYRLRGVSSSLFGLDGDYAVKIARNDVHLLSPSDRMMHEECESALRLERTKNLSKYIARPRFFVIDNATICGIGVDWFASETLLNTTNRNVCKRESVQLLIHEILEAYSSEGIELHIETYKPRNLLVNQYGILKFAEPVLQEFGDDPDYSQDVRDRLGNFSELYCR